MVSEAFVDTYASIYLWEEAYLADEKKYGVGASHCFFLMSTIKCIVLSSMITTKYIFDIFFK